MRGYGQARWQRARAHALRRAHNRCETCGTTHHLRVHHLDGAGMGGPRACDPTNLKVLCESCHRTVHARLPTGDDHTIVFIPSYRRE